ncbi:MAG: hypothetical protein GXC78_05575 [Chitinophagaceae bacterium]|nr:hypothetical protein [Chitinophagaceae bacterium]
MTIEQAITHRFTIARLGEKVFFQLRLPRDSRRVIGVEYDVRKTSGEETPYVSLVFDPDGDPYFKRNTNKLIGRLSLQNRGCEGLFYQGDLIEDHNKAQYEGIHAQLFSPEPWMHSRKREEIDFNVSSGVVEGFFEDANFGQYEYVGLEYEVFLYLWIEKCVA